MTIVIVTHPRNSIELRWALASFDRFARDPFAVLLITEPEHVTEIAAVHPAARVEAMPVDVLSINEGYWRQQAAKMFPPPVDSRIVFTDDDTEAIAPWGVATFFQDGRARMHFEASDWHAWASGTQAIYGRAPRRRWQLRLPFAIHGDTLAALAASPVAARCMARWRRGGMLSEFEVMGEWAFREAQRDERTQFLPGLARHWSLGPRPCFRDWQGERRRLRQRLAQIHAL